MKNIFFTVMSIIIATNLNAQNKNDNVILAKGVYFKQVVNTLLNENYNIDKLDSNFNIIKTEYKNMCPDCLPKLMFDIRIKDSVAYIKGKWKSDGGVLSKALTGENTEMIFDIINEKSKVPRLCFQEMQRIALLLSNQVSYAKL